MSSTGDVWADRVLSALGDLEASRQGVDMAALTETVAAKYASKFSERDRQYQNDQPYWHNRVQDAVALLRRRKLVAPKAPKSAAVRLTKAGDDAVAGARERAETAVEPVERVARAAPPEPSKRDPVLAGVVTPPLRAAMAEESNDTPLAIMIELNLTFQPSVAAAIERVGHLWGLIGGPGTPVPLADQFVAGELTPDQIKSLVSADAVPQDWAQRAVYRIWPDFEVHPQIDASSTTIKAVAAQRSFGSFGEGIVWAVVDSGIDETHPHFDAHQNLHDPAVADLHHDFTGGNAPLTDTDGHGTHVAAIIAGGLVGRQSADVVVVEKRLNDPEHGGDPITAPRTVADPDRLAGMAPKAKLVSLKVLGPGDRASRVSRVMQALAYVRKLNAGSERVPRIHGVNLSLGYEFDAEWYACGQSPMCIEVDKTVRSGVVVVVAAGNSGYVSLNTAFSKDSVKFTADMTINDPGNTESAITVGSTHRSSPHTFGVSYFSSRGPTGDGRRKPDLVAPGERITSAAAGDRRAKVTNQIDVGPDVPVYVEESGTSMAAPHVSGAIAAFLSVQREFVSEPEAVKRIFVDSATSLNRDPAFQGSGLVDLMRALQSV
ncbi:S8 family peptidase [Mycolicibacterium neworleansense]|uniref:Peptidase S8/S53 subtilisin kexin sedolisin n=1 Tax=Mycolicibacterium neworleansense TaxID=146018 RepID=A0A0H5RJB8_9MYCO|nr:S8 family peptidase [Mycolicibacterium neworleansense]CRZ13831.1 peptidase S8/S53 subtilisin kexin sedolisin [Mycolicibacterium neworleansense]